MKFRKITQLKCQIFWILELRTSMKTIVIFTANLKMRMGCIANMWNENDLGNIEDIAWHLLLFSHSVMSDHCYPMDCSPLSSSVMGLSRQEYWSGLTFPSPEDLPNPRIETCTPALTGIFFTTEPPVKPRESHSLLLFVR